MGEREIVPGVYRHFKGNKYEVLGVAKHSETEEPLVVYRALYGEGGLWVRPLEMFVGRVDKGKYPDASQEFRFELVRDKGTCVAQGGAPVVASGDCAVCDNASSAPGAPFAECAAYPGGSACVKGNE